MTHWLETASKEQIEDVLEAMRRAGYGHISDEMLITHLVLNKFCYTIIPFLDHQWPEFCLAACRENCNALRYVNDQTLEVCLAAATVRPGTAYSQSTWAKYVVSAFIRDPQMQAEVLRRLGCS